MSLRSIAVRLSAVASLALAGCAPDDPVIDPSRAGLLIPIGRSCVGASTCTLTVDGAPFTEAPFFDGFGGYWIRVPLASIGDGARLTLRITRRRDDPAVRFRDPEPSSAAWLRPSALVDSDHPDIVAAAGDVLARCTDCPTNEAKAVALQRFVIDRIAFRTYEGLPTFKASDAYRRRYGVCIDYARLFVALARAASVPARTVEGIVQSREVPGLYDGHHEWAEIRDEAGYWHPLDFSYSTAYDLTDVSYLDLVYATEESPYYKPFFETDYRPYAIASGDVVVFSVEKTIHGAAPGLGYRLIENRYPEYVVLENTFVVEVKGDRVHIGR